VSDGLRIFYYSVDEKATEHTVLYCNACDGWDVSVKLGPLSVPSTLYIWWVWSMGVIINTDREKLWARSKTCSRATLSTKNPTWTDPGANRGLRGEKTATDGLTCVSVSVCASYSWILSSSVSAHLLSGKCRKCVAPKINFSSIHGSILWELLRQGSNEPNLCLLCPAALQLLLCVK
jgi:hypothetical protein